MHVLAPAKVNVYLRITGRRPDGYHLLDSVMVPISLYDELELTVTDQPEQIREKTPQILLSCDDPALPTDGTNLAYKAAALFCKEAEVAPLVTIFLRKRIPYGAGLGGGSSDAAAVLKGLNLLFARRFSDSHLCTLAVRLGADVPFFIPCRPARVEGIGEKLSSIPVLPLRWLVIVAPPFGISTPWAYQQFDKLLAKTGSLPFELQRLLAGHWPGSASLVNDLEQAVIPAYPAIGEIKRQLVQAGAEDALMSGSGSSIFGIFSSEMSAKRAVEVMRNQGKTFLVEPLAGSSMP